MFRCSYLFSNTAPTAIHLHSDTHGLGSMHQLLAVPYGFIHHWKQSHLHGGQPQREVPRGALYQHSEEALQGPEDGSVHHNRPLLAVVCGSILQFKALGQIEVTLNCRALPFAPDRVPNLYIYFRTIECTATLIETKRPAFPPKCALKCYNGFLPDLVTSNAVFRASAQHNFIFNETKRTQNSLNKVQNTNNLILQLRRQTEYVSIVLSETPNPKQAVQRPRPLIAIHST
mmetsp:Transcript_91774/g.179822  ORF Transcript_91774/g.179822 Transcript_91774/m.179822 type:complete len:230 (+) Transcript_91774:133-822(+)